MKSGEQYGMVCVRSVNLLWTRVCVCGYTSYSIHSFIHSFGATEAYGAVYLFTKATCFITRTHKWTFWFHSNMCVHSTHLIHIHVIVCTLLWCYSSLFHSIVWFVNVFVAINISISFSHACARVCVCVYIQVFDMMCCSLSGRLELWICVYANYPLHISLWFLYHCNFGVYYRHLH